ncbi:MAG: superoxide dismutase [Fe] [Alphaproteobacteria bacterium CG_4_10_14_0_2_um_filter_63_37]|nr:MAG: superoxide dismutase [Proteobacteria bacterium CG1_02_64_396]PJA24123.1 MAG: superoxide dismutase [Fe] [Alphaproteobacteria bacterium CG_4_10_14_0_2_um_filter_63_37]
MAIQLPDLPYAPTALEPYITAHTLGFHHGKHHGAYVANVNKMIEGTHLAGANLETIIQHSAADPAKAGLFNNAAQVWNHTFYWRSMKPGGGGQPNGKVLEALTGAFGSYEGFVDAFKTAGATQFGSGWAWLVDKGGKLDVMKTANADTPMIHGAKALLTVDVWEHAYYLDYQNRRPDYLKDFVERLIDWDFVAGNLG